MLPEVERDLRARSEKEPSPAMTLRPMMKRAVFSCGLALLATGAEGQAAERIAIVWPTPNPAFAQGKPIEAFIQHAGSGEAGSGCFGCVRSSGMQFHEGIDLKPVARDRHGEPTDEIVAAMDGVVRHMNLRAGESSYGRYIVLEHPDLTPAVYTLYAHLRRVAPGLKIGDRVARGQAIATMGHTAGGYAIPKDRAHLHFEIGLLITRDFQTWYNGRKFGSANEQGLYNGMNLMGLDPLDFLRQFEARRVDNFQQYFARMQPALRVRIGDLTGAGFCPALSLAAHQGAAPAGGGLGCAVRLDRPAVCLDPVDVRRGCRTPAQSARALGRERRA